MRNFLIGIAILMFFKNQVKAQNNYLNLRFAVISSKYGGDCHDCADISMDLYNKMKDDDIFQYSDDFPNWEDQKKNNFTGFKEYDIDFYLVSEIKRSALGYLVFFTLWKGSEQTDKQFIALLKLKELEVDKVQVSRDILEELRKFKLNGRFKKMILVDNFQIIPKNEDLVSFSEGFSDWLASQLSEHEIIKDNYSFFYRKTLNTELSNVIKGEFYPIEDRKFKMKMIIKLGKKESVRLKKTLTIDMIEYQDNINDILDAINTFIKKYERRT